MITLNFYYVLANSVQTSYLYPTDYHKYYMNDERYKD